MDRIEFLGFVLLLRDISRLDRYSTGQSIPVLKIVDDIRRLGEHVVLARTLDCANRGLV